MHLGNLECFQYNELGTQADAIDFKTLIQVAVYTATKVMLEEFEETKIPFRHSPSYQLNTL